MGVVQSRGAGVGKRGGLVQLLHCRQESPRGFRCPLDNSLMGGVLMVTDDSRGKPGRKWKAIMPIGGGNQLVMVGITEPQEKLKGGERVGGIEQYGGSCAGVLSEKEKGRR